MSLPSAPRLERFFPVILLALIAAGTFARLGTWLNVFTDQGVALKLTDSHYYVRFALLQLEAFPRFAAFDPFVNHPTGAHVIWPPFHTWLLAGWVGLFGGEPRADLAAAWFGPAVFAVHLGVVGLLCRRWYGAALSLAVVFTLALLPVNVEASALGNADHHFHEPVLVALCALSAVHALGTRRRRDALWAGAIFGAGRFFTTSSFVVFPLLALALAAWALSEKERAEAVREVSLWAAAAAAGVLAAGALLFGLPLSLQYEAFSAFHPLFAAACLLGAAAVADLRLRRRWPLALTAGGAALCAVPVLFGIWRAAEHLGRGDPLLRVVTESLPLYADPGWAVELFSLPLLLVPLALFGLVRAAVRMDALALFTSALTFPLIAATVAQVRFAQMLGGALALALPVGLVALTGPMSRTLRRIVAGAALAVALATANLSLHPDERDVRYDASVLARPTLEWMRDHTPPPVPPHQRYAGGAEPRYAVVARFDFGHLLMLWAQRPVVASPFGQAPWHQAGNARGSAVLAAQSDDEGFKLARATGARYLLATPLGPILGMEHVPRETTLVHRLLDSGGASSPHFRLVRDSAEARIRKEGGPFARLFEVVEGAVIEGAAPPGTRVEARLALVDHLGRRRDYARKTTAGEDGRYALRVAQPTEGADKGEVRALGPYVVRAGETTREVEVTLDQVRHGARVK